MWNQLKTLVLLGTLSVGLVGLGGLLGEGFLVLSIALAIALNVGAYFFSDRVVLAVTGARDVPRHAAPELHAIVEELAQRAGIPKPRVCFVDEAQPNAFATGRSPRHGVVAVTRGLLALLDRRELRGVIAHEIAHIANRDVLIASIAATIASALTYLANALTLGALFGGDDEEDGGGLLLALVAPLAGSLVQLGISRSREFLADERGAALCGDPLALASALEKLERASHRIPAQVAPAVASLFVVNPLAGALGRSVVSLFSTHPTTDRRVARLRAFAGRSLRCPGRFATWDAV